MAAATAQPLYSLDLPAFKDAINAYMTLAIPGLPPGMDFETNQSEVRESATLKSLPDLLANLGNPVSCPFCAVPLVKGTSARLCLACGKPLGPLPAGTADRWHGSVAERRFLASLNLSGEKRKYAPHLSSSAAAEASPTKPQSSSPSEPALPDDFFNPESLLGGGAVPGGIPVQLAGSDSSTASPVHHLHMFAAHSPNSSPIHEAHARKKELANKDDFFSQLSGLDSLASIPAPTPLQAPIAIESGIDPLVEELLSDVPDLSFMLSDGLIIPDKEPQGGVVPLGSSKDAQPPTNGQATTVAVTMSISESTTGQGGLEDGSDDDWGDFNS